MGLETATFIEDLVTTNPPASDELKQADDHMRLIKSVLKGTLPGLTRAMYFEKPRADVADSATPALWAATTDYANLLGTTTITGFASGTDGQHKLVRFDGIRQLTHHATTLDLPNDANITTAAGDHALIRCRGTTSNIVLAYFRADGSAIKDNTPEASETVTGTVEQATDAEVYAATAGAKAIMAEDLNTSSAPVALTDAATIALDWAAGINRAVTLGGNRTLGNPTNSIPGTWRRIQFTQDATGSRTITWGNQYVHPGGVDAVLSTTANAVDTVYIYCRTTSIFEVHVGGKAWAT